MANNFAHEQFEGNSKQVWCKYNRFEPKSGCYNIEVHMYQIDGIDIVATRNFSVKSLKRCCKIRVVLLLHDFYQVIKWLIFW
jgi:hypothetical protein